MSSEQTPIYTSVLLFNSEYMCDPSELPIYTTFILTLGIAGMLSFSTLLPIPCYRQLRQRRFIFQFNIVLADFISTIAVTFVIIFTSVGNPEVYIRSNFRF